MLIVCLNTRPMTSDKQGLCDEIMKGKVYVNLIIVGIKRILENIVY
jgi:hypothetical protein